MCLIRPLSNNIFSLVAISMSLSTISFIRSSKLVEDSQFNKLFALDGSQIINFIGLKYLSEVSI